MNDQRTTALEQVKYAITGTMLGQLALANDVSLESVTAPDSPVLQELRCTLSTSVFEPEVLAKQAMASLTDLFMKPSNAEEISRELTTLLWTILGDPESGEPPELYRRAGHYMHLSMVAILCPDILEPLLQQRSSSS